MGRRTFAFQRKLEAVVEMIEMDTQGRITQFSISASLPRPEGHTRLPISVGPAEN
eukprot:gene8468-5944_t